MKQLDELAREYMFDPAEARRFLGIEAKKRGRPAKKPTDSDDDEPKKCVGGSCKKSPKEKRAPSGYNLFIKNKGLPITEAAKQWKSLSESTRTKWNNKAASAWSGI